MKSAEEILKPYIFEKAGKVNVNDALQAMHEYAAQDRWVKVSDRLPEVNKQILFRTGNGEFFTGHYGAGFAGNYAWWQKGKGYGYIENVTHWQPLPTAPKD